MKWMSGKINVYEILASKLENNTQMYRRITRA
jgi:hypothetical protein